MDTQRQDVLEDLRAKITTGRLPPGSHLTERLLAKSKDLDVVVRRVIRLTTGRVPKEGEVKADVAFIEKMRKEEGLDLKKAVASYCLLALNTNEFMYLD